MGFGNGDPRLLSLRWLWTVWRPPPEAFTGRNVDQALRAEGWGVHSGPPNEWHIYRHPEKPDAIVTFNPNTPRFEAGDATFQILARQWGSQVGA